MTRVAKGRNRTISRKNNEGRTVPLKTHRRASGKQRGGKENKQLRKGLGGKRDSNASTMIREASYSAAKGMWRKKGRGTVGAHATSLRDDRHSGRERKERAIVPSLGTCSFSGRVRRQS